MFLGFSCDCGSVVSHILKGGSPISNSRSHDISTWELVKKIKNRDFFMSEMKILKCVFRICEITRKSILKIILRIFANSRKISSKIIVKSL